MLPAGGSAQYYVEDLLGTSRVMTTNTGTLCYDADFYPYGGERPYTNSCPTSNNYKFEGKERDTETGNDDFGARYYSNFFGRWLSADWSSVPVAVPYANLTNPQTLNLYAMVSDDPETSADLTGHCGAITPGAPTATQPCNNGPNGPGATGDGSIPFDENTGIADWYTGEVSAASAQYAAQQAAAQNANGQAQNQGKECGFFCRMGHGLSNLFHGHSWNYINATVTTVEVESHVVREPNEYVTATTDAAGLAGLAVPERVAKPLGRLGAVASILNDPSPNNIMTNVLGLFPGFEAPMAITGAFNDFLDWGVNNSHPGPVKASDPFGPQELQPRLPAQDGGCLAAGLPSC